MNYRRGLQRLYAVSTVAWVGVLLFALPADRLNFWSTQPSDWVTVHGPWEKYSTEKTDYTALAEQVRQNARLGQKVKTVYPGEYNDLSDVDLGAAIKAKYPSVSEENLSADWFARNAPLSKTFDPDAFLTKRAIDGAVKANQFTIPPVAPSRIQRALWLAGVLLLPPACGYLIIFLVTPWIYRGFRPGTQI